MKNIGKHKKNGQSLVEFALILPLFLLFAVLIFDFGRAVYYYNALHNAAREGARYGVIHPNDEAGTINAAEKYAIGLGIDDLIVSASWMNSEPVGNDDIGISETYAITVTIDYCFVPVTPYIDVIIRQLNNSTNSFTCDFLPMKSNAIMRTETKPSQ